MFLLPNLVFSQCATTINTFPYNEGFETSTGGWVSGGIADDWAWGNPNKLYIQNAGGGSKCFVTGGLNGSTYNLGERSYVTSPCFNFTNLINPHVSFKIYWESEYNFDGTTFQYSTNNGTTWYNVGSSTDPVNCLNDNWFNHSNITYLTNLANPKHGWSGSQASGGGCGSSNGSNGWVTAQHCMSNLAGVPSVQFRFAFGAGTFCNDFDGFAFDDIQIGEAPANNANFTYSCSSTPLGYQFTNTSALCPDMFAWDFGDLTSGAANYSTSTNPTHVFTAPGTYTVTLTVSGPCNAPSTITKTITTTNAVYTSSSPSCISTSGSIQSTGSSPNGGLSYILQPGNITNSNGIFNGLSGGTYTITTTDAANCSLTNVITLTQNSPMLWSNFIVQPISCNGTQDGQIQGIATGGSNTFSYSLQPGSLVNGTGTFSSLTPSNYTITATDANNCTISSVVNFTQPLPISQLSLSQIDPKCFGDNTGGIASIYTGGAGSLTYTLLPIGSSNSTGIFTGLTANTYTISVSDANNCSQSTVVSLSNPAPLQINSLSLTQPTCNPNNNGSIYINASGGTSPLQYSMGGGYFSSPNFTGLTPNNYTMTVKDANGCSVSSIANLLNSNAPIFSTPMTESVSCPQSTDGKIETIAVGTSAIISYTLNPGNVISSVGQFSNLTAGNYTIIATDANSCSNTIIVTVASPQPITFTKLMVSQGACGGANGGTLEAETSGGTGAIVYSLNPGNLVSYTGTYTALGSGPYTLIAKDANQCFISTVINVPEKNCCTELFLPTAFSPNQDLTNDEFKILNAGGTNIKDFLIFNRWGEQVFTSHTAEHSWNGNHKGMPAEIGTYYYLVRYECLADGREYIRKGDFLLIR